MFTKTLRNLTITALLILSAFFLGDVGRLWAFSVDVTKLYYADPVGVSPNTRQINYDFSTGTISGNTISIPDASVIKPPVDANLTYTFGPYHEPDNAIALQLNSGYCTLSTATNGGAIINTNAIAPNPPSQSQPLPEWTFAVKLQNFTGMADSTKEYRAQIGFGSPVAAPHPELTAVWRSDNTLVLQAQIYDDTGNGTHIWSATPVTLGVQNPATTVLNLRVSRPAAPSADQIVFEYSLNGGVWTVMGSYTIPTVQLNSTFFLSFHAAFPFVDLRVETPGGGYAPYSNDANTVLLDHFDGATSASILAYSETGAACGAAKPSATPNSSYVNGPGGLSQALSLNPPTGEPAGSGTYLQYPGGQLLSQANGTLEFWTYLTTYGAGVGLVNQGPFPGSCNGWTYHLGVNSSGQLRSAAWAAFDVNSGATTVPLNTWTHVAASWGSAGAKLYINGVQVGSDANTGMPASGYAGSVLVDYSAVGLQIDELRISNVQRTSFSASGQAGTGTHNASGTYTWNATTGVITNNWTSTDFTCDGPDLGTETFTATTLTATTMILVYPDGWTDTWSRPSGTAGDIVGTWTLTDSWSGNSYMVTFNAEGTVSVTGVIVACGGGGDPNPSAQSQHWSNGYYVQLNYHDSPKTATAVSVTGPGITDTKALTYNSVFGSWNSWTSPSTAVSFGTTKPTTGLPFTYTFTITDTSAWTATSTVSCFQEAFATNLSPTGSVTGTPTFSWTGIADSSAVYGVEVNDGSGNRIWNNYDIIGTSIVYNGPSLTPGVTYNYNVNVQSSSACSSGTSFAQGSFTYGGGAGTSLITVTSDATTLAAPVGTAGIPSSQDLARLDTADTSGLVFQPALVGAYGTFTGVPQGAPMGTQVINIPSGNGQNGYFKATFTLPAGFTGVQLTGAFNVDDLGRVFLNGNALTPTILTNPSSSNSSFSMANTAFFNAGTNELLISDANTGDGPSGAAFYATISYIDTANLLQNGSFNGSLKGWTVQPTLDATGWNPLQPDGTVGLHPLSSGYTGNIIYQNLNISGITGRTFTLSMKLTKTFAPSGNTVAAYLTYVDGSGTTQRVRVLNPGNDSITANTIVTGTFLVPAGATKIIRLDIAKEDYGDFKVDDISLSVDGSVTVGPIPTITGISSASGLYGSSLTITGQNFGATQGSSRVVIRGTSQTVVSWSDTSITITLADATRTGHLSVVVDNVQSNSSVANVFEVTSPYYVADVIKNNIKVIKGQKAEFVLNLQFFNNYSTTQGIGFTTDQPSLNPVLTPVPVLNAGGVVMKIDTANLAAGTYRGNIQYGEGVSATKSAPFTLQVVTATDIKFYNWVYDPNTTTSTKTYVTQIDVAAQGMITGFMSINNEVTASDGSVMTGIPLAFAGNDPRLITLYKNNFGGYDFYAEGANGQATVNAVTPDGFTKQLTFNINIPATPQVTSIGLSPSFITNKYADTIAFSATGTQAIGYGSAGMLAIKEDTRAWYNSNLSISGTFKLDLTTPPDLGNYLFNASVYDANYNYVAQKVVPLTIVNDPSYAMIKGGVRLLDASIPQYGLEGFTLEFYDALGVKQFSRAYWSYAHGGGDPNFEIGAIPPGTYKIKFVPGMSLIRSQWWPNADNIGGAQPVTFAAGAVVGNVYFFAQSSPTISFTGAVRDSSVTSPTTGNPIAGASVSVPEFYSSWATTDTSGNFVLTGIPVGQTFTINVTAPNYVPVYSGELTSMASLLSSWPFVLFTTAELSQPAWQSLWQTGKGMITSRVVNSANPSQPLAGAQISVTSSLGNTYNVTYVDGTAFGGSATAANGLFFISGITPGDRVTVTASETGWAFNTNTYVVRSDSISEQLLFGVQGGVQTISYSDAVKDEKGRPVVGATVEVVGSNPPLQTITDGSGTFTISGIPAGQTFSLKITMPGYLPTYSSNLKATGNVTVLDRAFSLYTAAEVAGWGLTAGKGVIVGMVKDGQDPARAGIGGVVVTAQGGSKSYTVTYRDDVGNVRTDRTYGNGQYVVLNVDAGDTVTVTARKASWDFPTRVFVVQADSVSQRGLPGNRTMAGTWGDQTQGHMNASGIGGSAMWYAESGTLTFTDNAVPGTGGTAQDAYTRNENGSLTTGTASFTYASPVRNADGSYTVNVTGNSSKPLHLSISEDGNIAFADEPGSVALGMLVRIDPSKTYGNIDLSGTYYGIGYEYNANPVAPVDGGSGGGNGANMAISNLTSFNGAGSYTYLGRANSDGIIWTDNQQTTTRQYSVAGNGAISIQNSAFRGYLAGNGNVGLGGGAYVSNAQSWMSYIFLKKADRIYSTADLAGKWVLAAFGDHADGVGGTDVHADTGVSICDAAGICNVTVNTLHSDGSTTSSFLPLTFTVNADGSFVNAPGSTVPTGAIGNNGKMMIWNRSFDNTSERTIVVAIKVANAVMSPINNNIWSGTHHDVTGYYADFVVADPNHALTSVTVAGPGITGAQNLVYRSDAGAWWTIPQPLIGTTPPVDTFYSLTLTDGAGNQAIVQQRISGGVAALATNLLPVGDVTGKITFSFTGIAGADGYLVHMFDANGNMVWQSGKVLATSIPYAGPPLTAGSYNYLVHSWMGNNTSIAKASFNYAPPVQYPAGDVNHDKLVNLADALIALKAVAGLGVQNVFVDGDVNNDGLIGRPEALFVMQALAGLRVTDRQAALDGVNASLAAYKATINTKGASLTSTDLLPFFHPGYLNSGLNRGQGAQADLPKALVVIDTFTVNRVIFFDNVRKIMTAELVFTGTENGLAASEIFTETFAFDATSGKWLRYGNQRIGEFSVWTGISRTMNSSGNIDSNILHFHLWALPGTVKQVVVSGPGLAAGGVLFSKGGQRQEDGSDLFTSSGGSDLVVGRAPAVGDAYMFAVTKTDSTTVTYMQTSQAVLPGAPLITSPASHALTSANIGNSLPVAWTLPAGITAGDIKLSGQVCSVSGCQHVDGAVTSNTDGTITLPAMTNPTSAYIDVRVHHGGEVFMNCVFEFN